jgi:glycine cleavage system H protein
MAYPSDRKYTKDHEWIRVSGDTAEIGITEYAQQQLGDVVYVDLPDVGKTVTRAIRSVRSKSVKAVSELFAPDERRSRRGQQATLKDHPERVNSDPHRGWMIKIPHFQSCRHLGSARQRTSTRESVG